jgi:sec-independent protein translocase protein TatA
MRLGMGEIGFLIILAVMLFGAKRLPEVGRAAGSAIREFKTAIYGGAAGADKEKGGSSESEESIS